MNSKKTMDQAALIEYVTFSAKEGVVDNDLEAAIFRTDPVLDEVDGFIRRDVAKQQNGTWVEIVYWENDELAQNGLDTFLKDSRSQDFLNMIVSDSVKIEYMNVVKKH